jgi:hypothetical protein
MCLKKAEFHLDAHSAQRFAEAARGYTEELPWRLARSSERGLQRLDEAVQAGGADVAVTLIRALMSPSNLDPRYKVTAVCQRANCTRPWLYARHALVVAPHTHGYNRQQALMPRGTIQVAHGLCLQQLAASPGFFDMLAEVRQAY